jgi:predicted nucleic acid-binding protein
MDRLEERRPTLIRYVIDASSMGPLLLRDETSNAIAEIMQAVKRGECVVPAHWRFEVANMILVAQRRGRIDAEAATANLADLDLMPVVVDEASLDHVFDRTSALAREHGLTVYDAAYLEVAERRTLILVSQDGQLLKAARACHVEVVGA